ncbi:MAG: PEP-CTERM sorting domain-containing protein [Fimbriimonadaceae bacterium]|nr:PEP-CTERM sorting domain-containing protein [Fimbriimonadaceae bacterium]QYK56688.1 MAG: PEP-CTERM sorting domain-containing protein [Fimbriimonadaceae bacterium]
MKVREEKMLRCSALIAVIAGAAISSAQFTMATFADPSTTSAEPLFAFDLAKETLSGGWDKPGLTLITPGFTGGGQTENATFTFSEVALTFVIPGIYRMGPGNIKFYDADPNSPIFTITFDSGTFVRALGVGASKITADNVQFSGPRVPTGLSQETFSFSLANAIQNGAIESYTASFTSSATPEPATMVALGAGIAALVARRRKA